MVHGAFSHRNHELFVSLAELLPLNTIRVDFTGCGESSGVWKLFESLNTDLEDLKATEDFVKGLNL